MKCVSYDEVYTYYQELISRAKGKILKTDCYNEAFLEPIITTQEAVLVEYEQEYVDKALARFPHLNIIQGDIRNLHFEDESFDTVVDLSTIDHVPQEDLPIVFSEYYRVLKFNGQLLLVVWLTKNKYEGKEWRSTNQYFFEEDTVREYLDRFSIESEQVILVDKALPNCYLKEFVCLK
ncbi:MAG: class I SAM-dependent methyltransferase [Patescibacteria group bacterium]|jgi:ubiquinone/menaquinone biosynthesis C-methylase UbiE